MKSPVTRSRGLAIATVAAFAVALVPVGAATAAPAAKCDNRNNNTISKLLECVDADGAIEHLEAFQAIADANGGNRAAGTAGLRGQRRLRRRDARGRRLERLDRRVRLHVRRPVDARAADAGATPTYPTGPFTGTGYGDVTAAVIPVDLSLADADRRRPAAARPADFAGLPGRATSRSSSAAPATSAVKALNAEAAGAAAVIIFNQGNARDRLGPHRRHPGRHRRRRHPRRRRELRSRASRSSQAGSTARVMVPPPEQRPQKNVIAELPGQQRRQRRHGRRAPRLGAGRPGHQRQRQRLGRAARARPEPVEAQAARTPSASRGGVPRRRASSGRTAYVDGLSPGGEGPHRAVPELRHGRLAELHLHGLRRRRVELRRRRCVGARGIGRRSRTSSRATSRASASRTTTPSSAVAATTRPSSSTGIPAGGLFTGAEVVKTAEQEAIWGGTAGESYDPCYHQACDTIDNINARRARRQLRRDRARRARLLLLHGVGERRGRQEHPRRPQAARRRPVLRAPTGSGGGHSHGDVE